LLYSHYSGALRDITSGDNGGYQATPGWDACTGWGSPGGSSLLQAMQPQAMHRQIKERISAAGGADLMGGQEMGGQQSMMNQLLTVMYLEKLLDDRRSSRFDDGDFPDILSFLLLTNMSRSWQAQTTGAPQPPGMAGGGGSDISNAVGLLLLLSLRGRRTSGNVDRAKAGGGVVNGVAKPRGQAISARKHSVARVPVPDQSSPADI